MNFKEFSIIVEKNPKLLKESTTVLARRYKVSEEVIKDFRKKYRVLQEVPSLETLESVGFKVDSRVPIAPKGFEISSFKLNKDNQVQDQWFKKIDSEKIDNNIDWNSIKPKVLIPSKNIKSNHKCLQIIFPTDSHINRLEVEERSLSDKCQEVLDKTVEAVQLAQKLYSIDKIVFITGSDMFNSTGKNPFTVKNTLQENLCTYDKTFEAAINLNVSIIDFLYQNCNQLEVYSILGNHDEVECYMLGKYLQAYYRNFNIKFDVDKKYRKYIDFGNTGICINHGDIPKFENLIAAMASERPDIYCKKYTECIVGDKHFQKVTQLGKTIVRQYPSLAKNDTWSDSCGFCGESFVSEIYDFEKGHILSIDLKN